MSAQDLKAWLEQQANEHEREQKATEGRMGETPEYDHSAADAATYHRGAAEAYRNVLANVRWEPVLIEGAQDELAARRELDALLVQQKAVLGNCTPELAAQLQSEIDALRAKLKGRDSR